ncbi:MAG: hypothetical protein J6W90_04525 [Verrucomicrobia bacterium]|jgi:hypothetical protein|nr:hypothetical protein [Verrucomicrobiota bacterium]MBO7391387.1 hypothetical protein [Verrucomicrobiota bacterium]MBP5760623.1 hypothetical protein [Verrucomicrobiota bacterium]
MLKKKLSILTAMLIAASAPITWNATAQESPELPPAPEVQKAPARTLQLTDDQKAQLKNILSEEQYQKLTRLYGQKKALKKNGNFARVKKGRAFRNNSAPDQPCARAFQGRGFHGKMMARNHGPMMKGQRNRFMDDSFRGQNCPCKMSGNTFHPKNRGMERKMKRG